jgi:CDP-diacylglycerol--glycerol-3-phosphate 3-phosphatidyltransferase
MARIALVLVWLLFAERLGAPAGTLNVATLAVAALYILIASTDKLDGYLARSRGEVTTLGKFLDPIADKLVVVFTLLVLYSWGLVSVWVLVVILTREFLVSGLRMQVAAEGVVVAASNLGKLKTATTMVAIAAYLIYAGLPAGAFATALGFIAAALMVAAVFFTLWSGVDYFFKCSHLLT